MALGGGLPFEPSAPRQNRRSRHTSAAGRLGPKAGPVMWEVVTVEGGADIHFFGQIFDLSIFFQFFVFVFEGWRVLAHYVITSEFNQTMCMNLWWSFRVQWCLKYYFYLYEIRAPHCRFVIVMMIFDWGSRKHLEHYALNVPTRNIFSYTQSCFAMILLRYCEVFFWSTWSCDRCLTFVSLTTFIIESWALKFGVNKNNWRDNSISSICTQAIV